MSDTAQCEICGLDGPESSFYLGWGGYVCTDNPECRPPMGPRRREVALIPIGLLDDLEWVADEAEQTCQDADVSPAVLRALIDAARRALAIHGESWEADAAALEGMRKKRHP